MNIVEEITKQLGGGMVGKLSSFLGEPTDKTQTAVGAAVPTLLAGISQTASTPEGAQRLSSAASENAGVLDKFGDAVSGDTDSITAKGGSALQSLLGGGMTTGISSVLGRFTGMKGDSTSGLLKMLAPMILGVLGQHQRKAGLNASGLAGFLGSQKQNIAGAMPRGLSSMLSGIPGLSGFGEAETVPKWESVTEQKKPAYVDSTAQQRETYESARPVHEREREHAGSSKGKWVLGLCAALAALGIFWVVSNRDATDRDLASTQITEPAGAPRPASAQVTTDLRETLNKASSTLNGITDAPSAEKALPQLQSLNTQLARAESGWNNLPTSAKSTAAAGMEPVAGKIGDSISRVQDIPNLSEKAKSALSQMEEHVSRFRSPDVKLE